MKGVVETQNGSEKYQTDRLVWIAFFLMVIFAGGNPVAVRFSNSGLPAFWGATLRFGSAALIFWIIVLARRIPLPRGRAFMGTLLYGVLSVGAAYGCLYWGLVRLPASFAGATLAFVPLMTLFFAWMHGLEKLQWRGVAGALIATAGILSGLAGGLGFSAHIPSMIVMVAGVACLAESSVFYKLMPKSDPMATNALALTAGAPILMILSLIAGEQRILPESSSTWAAYAYLVIVGSVGVFYLYLYVLSRWTASKTSYSFLLMPVSTAVFAVWLAGETLSTAFLIGAGLVIAGVWVGAIHQAPKTTEITCSGIPNKSIG
jgi:drug/metabolite transporter (DMT)-like permease